VPNLTCPSSTTCAGFLLWNECPPTFHPMFHSHVGTLTPSLAVFGHRASKEVIEV
jgi:hypothetical protein